MLVVRGCIIQLLAHEVPSESLRYFIFIWQQWPMSTCFCQTYMAKAFFQHHICKIKVFLPFVGFRESVDVNKPLNNVLLVSIWMQGLSRVGFLFFSKFFQSGWFGSLAGLYGSSPLSPSTIWSSFPWVSTHPFVWPGGCDLFLMVGWASFDLLSYEYIRQTETTLSDMVIYHLQIVCSCQICQRRESIIIEVFISCDFPQVYIFL